MIFKKGYSIYHPQGQPEIKPVPEGGIPSLMPNGFEHLIHLLRGIKPCDLSKETTPMKDAVKMCEEILTILVTAENLNLDQNQQAELAYTLKKLGCCGQKDAADKFLPLRDANMEQLLTEKDNIQLPLILFQNLLECKSKYANLCVKTFVRGENSPCNVWLAARKKQKMQPVEQA